MIGKLVKSYELFTFKKVSFLNPILRSFIIFVMVLVMAGFSGCGSPQDTQTITVWHWMSDRDNAFHELALRYEKEKGVKVRFELYAPSDIYAQKIKAAAQTQTLPDIFGVLGEKRDFASFIKSGFVANLTNSFEYKPDGINALKSKFFEKAIGVNEFKSGNEYGVPPGIYGVPLDVMTIQMVFNKTLLARAGLDPNVPPDTWDQLLSTCQVLEANGIPCFVSGFGEIWMIDALASNMAMNLMGEEKVFKTYAGEVPYTDPDWVKVLGLFKQMRELGVLVQGAVTMVNKTAEQTFANERAAFAFNGSWCVNVYQGMNPKLEYGAALPPKITNLNPMRIWGGAGSSFVVNEKSPRRDKTIEFLMWLADDAQQAYLADATQNLPSNKNSLSKISPILAQFADDMDNTVHPNTYPIRELPTVTEAFDKGIQSILIGEKTPAQVAKEIQALKEKELRKKL